MGLRVWVEGLEFWKYVSGLRLNVEDTGIWAWHLSFSTRLLARMLFMCCDISDCKEKPCRLYITVLLRNTRCSEVSRALQSFWRKHRTLKNECVAEAGMNRSWCSTAAKDSFLT